MNAKTIIRTMVITAVILGFVSISQAGDRFDRRPRHQIHKQKKQCARDRHHISPKQRHRPDRFHGRHDKHYYKHNRHYKGRYDYRDRHYRKNDYRKSNNANSLLFPNVRLAITPLGIFPVLD
ncbi:Uncharacterized protein dnl_05870 [Desulfonema limicola]|uniref:Uncharacterized protein n=1 Tax=Desulfonema limicola TaxID=45656 RepID=A0A975B3Y8_9BACT|nr:hypothetical protein [Desulfonema limicola]QTA78365.1 Uncharacterized protein dnl_05870 [Desulfonema limicola]